LRLARGERAGTRHVFSGKYLLLEGVALLLVLLSGDKEVHVGFLELDLELLLTLLVLLQLLLEFNDEYV
jgi:hypothetical protein